MDKIAVIIPVIANENYFHINKTLESVYYNCSNVNGIEVWLIADGWKFDRNKLDKRFLDHVGDNLFLYEFSTEILGQRFIENFVTSITLSKYILRLDAHCLLPKDWDLKYMEGLKLGKFVIPTIKSMEFVTFELRTAEYRNIYISPSGKTKWWHKCPLNVSMASSGTGWFCEQEYYRKHLIRDINLPKWGCMGFEISIKNFIAGEKIHIVPDLYLGHVFHTKRRNDGYAYSLRDLIHTERKLLRQYSKELYLLANSFDPKPPSWGKVKKDFIEHPKKYFCYGK